MKPTPDRFQVVHVNRNGIGAYQVKDTTSNRVRSVYSFERFAVSKAAQLNREEACSSGS